MIRFIVLHIIFFFVAGLYSSSKAQAFWTEDFENNCSVGCFASSYSGSNGAWSLTDNSTGGAPNQWFVSCAENGQPAGSCGSGCGSDESLHVGANPNSYCTCFVCGATNGDCGAAYDACGSALCFFNSPATDKRIESPTIDCSGQSSITISFDYIENGQGTTDNATLWYFDGSTWSQLADMGKTSTCGGQGLWTLFSTTLPASANNNPNVKIGFRWVNNADGIGSDPSFAVDDIELTTPLPVQLVSFEGQQLGDKMLLTWTTATENNNAYFTLEHSTDGETFTKISKVSGQGQSTTKKLYKQYHYQPVVGTNYYRLKQHDQNGSSTIEEHIAITFHPEQTGHPFIIRPNPVKNYLNVHFQPGLQQKVLIKIIDMTGQVVQKSVKHVQNQKNTVKLHTEQLTPGIYFLQVHALESVKNNSVLNSTTKFIKK